MSGEGKRKSEYCKTLPLKGFKGRGTPIDSGGDENAGRKEDTEK